MTTPSEAETRTRLEPYFYVRDHNIDSFEKYDKFVEQFPDCSDSLVMAIISKIIKKERGVGLFGE